MSDPSGHSLWQRQLRRATRADGGVDLALLGQLVCDAYRDSDRAMRLSERATMLASEELGELADRLQAERDANLAAWKIADEASKAKSAFLANMSHELRTPLNAIIGYSEIVQEDADANGHTSVAWDMGRVLHAARHLLALIQDVLDISKVEAGKFELAPGRCDLDQLIAQSLETIRPQAQANGNVVSLERASSLGEAMVDGLRLKQCLLNLLSNAVKFTRNGAITVTAQRDSAGLLVRVADTGIGIPGAKLANLFEPFAGAWRRD